MAIPNRNINYPTAIKYGAGRIKELAEFCKANGIKRPLVVTDKGRLFVDRIVLQLLTN